MGSPLRVLHAVVNMNRGGAEMLIMNAYRNIDRSKVQFDFLTSKEGEFDQEIRSLGGTIYKIPYISESGHIKYLRDLHTFFKKHNNYKVVHSHMDRMSGLVLRVAKAEGVAVRIAHSHNTRSEGNGAVRLYKWYAGHFIKQNATHLMACSTDAAKWLFKKSGTAEILKNAIETERFVFSIKTKKQIRTELNIRDEAFVLGHVGRFNKQKNHSFLIDLFAQFQKEDKNSILILVGEGPLRNGIEKKVRDFQLEERVIILGPRSDIHLLLQAFDIFLFPSLHEGIPVSLIEAQAAGLPCVISDVISKEADLHLGLVEFAALNDHADWAEKLKKIKETNLNRVSDAETIAGQGYDIQKTASRLEQFYLDKIGGDSG
ncbi:glycosyltransferase family 1 protein [Heyndrickxia acidicola]|uniref:Glycosyltransferase family 1 protein n=1 Tax=Heyndrickxia acidicola TaxID=209389 RepID=A0ABU6MKI0_9BACI|nr:glycosyltransferase family 1 protein [Heyndrickxia acidicola]MED1205193.1 glycosyltransferase family 1 protein [Heyndrickxia acidicola]